jgi:hypothetical protein
MSIPYIWGIMGSFTLASALSIFASFAQPKVSLPATEPKSFGNPSKEPGLADLEPAAWFCLRKAHR